MYPDSVDVISDMMLGDEEIYEFVFTTMYSKLLNVESKKVLKKSYMKYLRKVRLQNEIIQNNNKLLKISSYNSNFKYPFKHKNEREIHQMFKNDANSINSAFQSISKCRDNSKISQDYINKIRKAILSYSIKINDKKLQKRIEKHL